MTSQEWYARQAGRGGPNRIGLMGNPYLGEAGTWLKRLPQYSQIAGDVMSAMESGAPSATGWADPMLREGIGQAMDSGMGSAEYAQQRSSIADDYRSAVGAAGFAGGAGGAYRPSATRRIVGREASQRLAPAMAGLEAKKEGMRREGIRTGLGALTSIYPTQARTQESARGAYGEYLGRLLGGASADRSPMPLTALQIAQRAKYGHG